MIGQQARIIPVLLVLSLLVGCHGLFNPHVKLKRQFIDEDKVRKPVSMDVAFTYADLAIDEYNAAIGNNATFESSSGLAFLVLGGGAVGTAASGGAAGRCCCARHRRRFGLRHRIVAEQQTSAPRLRSWRRSHDLR